MITSLIVVVLCFGHALSQCGPVNVPCVEAVADNGDGSTWTEMYGYNLVREGAHMFWWFYKTTHVDGWMNRPWIIWLQGGPGSSSTGYGNFELLGPEYVNLTARPYTWIQEVNVLFVDNPVGSGYSYVDELLQIAKNTDEIAADLQTNLDLFLGVVPQMRSVPLYIFGESYGGKMGIVWSKLLYNEINNNGFSCNLAGMAMGDAWISPMDSVNTWGDYLYWVNSIDEEGRQAVNAAAAATQVEVDAGRWFNATQQWGETERVVAAASHCVDFYNILLYSTGCPFTPKESIRSFILRNNLEPFADDDLVAMMNSPEMRARLQIIPETTIYDGQGNAVFIENEVDFMKSVVSDVDWMLQNTNVDVIVYQGQLDLICDTIGALDFVDTLTWSGLDAWKAATRTPFEDPDNGQTEFFVSAFDDFKFYWVMRSGHMVPKDTQFSGLRLLDRIVFDRD